MDQQTEKKSNGLFNLSHLTYPNSTYPYLALLNLTFPYLTLILPYLTLLNLT
jgi:hypothetical protein